MMRSRYRLILAMVLLGMCQVNGNAPVPSSDTAIAGVSNNPLHAARLRKLHLVRPDLINYPLSFEVVC